MKKAIQWIMLLGVVLLWTNPVDKDKWLKVRLWGWKNQTASGDSFQLGVLDSMRSGARESTHVNVGCIPDPQTWTFKVQMIDSLGNQGDQSDPASSVFLPVERY